MGTERVIHAITKVLHDAHALRQRFSTLPEGQQELLLGAFAELSTSLEELQAAGEEEKGRREFLAMVTHELKTPLTAIKGAAAMALSSTRPRALAEMHELLQIIDHQADRLRNLVDDLLDSSRGETGSVSLQVIPADLRAVLLEAQTTFVRSGGVHQIPFEIPTLPVAAGTSTETVPGPAQRAWHLGRVRQARERTPVLAVDDEPEMLRYLQRLLDEAGYRPIVTSDPVQVPQLVESEEPDLVLLDLMLPGTSGFDLLQRIREFSGVPVIFLSARNQNEHVVQGLKLGADDYVTKPFSPSELLARIEVVLRRRVLPDMIEARPSFVLGDLVVNFTERSVMVGGRRISLSATEYKLLYELANHAGRVLTHEQLLQRVWGPEYSKEDEVLRSFIRNLRRKLGDDAQHPKYIFTEPQVGYRVPGSSG